MYVRQSGRTLTLFLTKESIEDEESFPHSLGSACPLHDSVDDPGSIRRRRHS